MTEQQAPPPSWAAAPDQLPPGYLPPPSHPYQGYGQPPSYPHYGFGQPVWAVPIGYRGSPGFPASQRAQPARAPRPSVQAFALCSLAAGVLGSIGATMTWARVSGYWGGDRSGGDRSQDGYFISTPTIDGADIGVGQFCLTLSIAVVVLSVVLLCRALLGAAIAVLALGALVTVLAGVNVIGVDQIAGPSLEQYGFQAHVGVGLWLTLASGAGAACAGLAALVRASGRANGAVHLEAAHLDAAPPWPVHR